MGVWFHVRVHNIPATSPVKPPRLSNNINI